jgi:hypothetical protein
MYSSISNPYPHFFEVMVSHIDNTTT